MRTLWRFLVSSATTAIGLWVVTLLLPSAHVVASGLGPGTPTAVVYIIAGAIIVLLNTLVRPVLRLIGLPFTVITLGLFSVVINAIIVLISSSIADNYGVGLAVTSFTSAVLVTLILGVVSMFTSPLAWALRGR